MGLSKSANGRAMGCLILDSARMLGNVVSAFVFVALMVCFQSPPGCAQEEGIESEPGQSSRSVVELVSFIKATKTPEMRSKALKKLEKTGPRNRAEVKMLADAASDHSIRGLGEAAERALAVIVPGEEDLRGEYRGLLKHKDWKVQAVACMYLGKVKDRKSVGALGRHMARNPNIAFFSSRALGEIGDPSAIRLMIKNSKASRGESLEGIGGFGEEGAKALIKEANSIAGGKVSLKGLLPGNSENLKNLLHAMKLKLKSDSIGYLRTQKDHPNKKIREAVLESLGRLGDSSALADLEVYLYAMDPHTSGAAMDGLLHMQTRESLAIVEKALLRHKDPMRRAVIAAALGYFGWDESIYALEQAARGDQFESVRDSAREAIDDIRNGNNQGSIHHPVNQRAREEMQR